MSGTTFFQRVSNNWNSYRVEHDFFETLLPAPSKTDAYKAPIRSISALVKASLNMVVFPIALALHAVGYVINCAFNLLLSALLLVPAVFLAVVAPKSKLSDATSTAFKEATAQVLVAAAMAGLATVYCLASVVLQPVSQVSRGLYTVGEHAAAVHHRIAG